MKNDGQNIETGNMVANTKTVLPTSAYEQSSGLTDKWTLMPASDHWLVVSPPPSIRSQSPIHVPDHEPVHQHVKHDSLAATKVAPMVRAVPSQARQLSDRGNLSTHAVPLRLSWPAQNQQSPRPPRQPKEQTTDSEKKRNGPFLAVGKWVSERRQLSTGGRSASPNGGSNQ